MATWRQSPPHEKGETTIANQNIESLYSIEFAVDGLKMLYQFKLWKAASDSMFALVKEGSTILDRLKEGEVLNMKYYSTDTVCPTQYHDTKIEYITKEVQGRFKGHYLMGLAII